jgi:hypothetical protein
MESMSGGPCREEYLRGIPLPGKGQGTMVKYLAEQEVKGDVFQNLAGTITFGLPRPWEPENLVRISKFNPAQQQWACPWTGGSVFFLSG